MFACATQWVKKLTRVLITSKQIQVVKYAHVTCVETNENQSVFRFYASMLCRISKKKKKNSNNLELFMV